MKIRLRDHPVIIAVAVVVTVMWGLGKVIAGLYRGAMALCRAIAARRRRRIISRPTIDRKEFARLLKFYGNDLRKIK